jgi:hypothetical protein
MCSGMAPHFAAERPSLRSKVSRSLITAPGTASKSDVSACAACRDGTDNYAISGLNCQLTFADHPPIEMSTSLESPFVQLSFGG